tara:strand:- start:21804 stop:22103 length:300 start_codon:yes stop_codon:yes gene_type:complete
MDNTSNNNSEWRDRELGALWVRQGKGQKYLTGNLEIETMPGMTEKVKVVVFSNKGKSKNENAPDYVVYRSKPVEEAGSATEAVSANTQTVSEELPEALV